DDYVWPRKCNEQARKYIAENGGKVVAEEYVPFGAPNKFEEIVTRIKSAKPDMVLITLVGADNVNFNRTFAGFGLDNRAMSLSRPKPAKVRLKLTLSAPTSVISTMSGLADLMRVTISSNLLGAPNGTYSSATTLPPFSAMYFLACSLHLRGQT